VNGTEVRCIALGSDNGVWSQKDKIMALERGGFGD